MQIIYDPITMEVVTHKIGSFLTPPPGFETAWVEWPEYAKKCKVVKVKGKQAEVEVLEWHLTNDQMKVIKEQEFASQMETESIELTRKLPIFKNPAWGILYEESIGIRDGLITDFSDLLITQVATLEETPVADKAIDIIQQIDSSRFALTAITRKYLKNVALVKNAKTGKEVSTITGEK